MLGLVTFEIIGCSGNVLTVLNKCTVCGDSVEKVAICLWSKNFGLIEKVLEILAEGVANFRLSRP
jgi:hypothetical protein